MTPPRKPLLPLVESLGDNCELGFYLEANALQKGALLRYALLPTDRAIDLIRSRERRAFAFEDLIPYSRTMVLDRASGIAFHSKMHSTRTPEGWRFDEPGETRRALYADERSKYDYLLERFERNLHSDAPRVYAVKANEGVSEARVAALDEALRACKAPERFVLLVVEASDPPGSTPTAAGVLGAARALARGALSSRASTLDWRSDTVCRARVARFAPYDAAANVDLKSWSRMFNELAGEPKITVWLEEIARGSSDPAGPTSADGGDAVAA